MPIRKPSTGSIWTPVNPEKASDVDKALEAQRHLAQSTSLSQEQIEYTKTVAGKLSRSPIMAKHYMNELIQVFNGKKEMDKFINETGVRTGLKDIQLLRIMEKELGDNERLMQDPDARSIRNQFKERIKELSKYYG